MTLGQRIRELRTQRNLRLQDLSAGSGLSVPHLSDLERDRQAPSLLTVRRIATALQVSATDLLDGTDDDGALSGSLPPGLAELVADPAWAEQIDARWQRTLLRVEFEGQRLQDRDDWLLVFLTLRRMLG